MPKKTQLKGSYDLSFSVVAADAENTGLLMAEDDDGFDDAADQDAGLSGSFNASGKYLAGKREENVAGPKAPARILEYVALASRMRSNAVARPASETFKVAGDADMAVTFPFLLYPEGTAFDDETGTALDPDASHHAELTVTMALRDGTGKREANPVITQIRHALFPKPGPDLFSEILPAASSGNLDFYAVKRVRTDSGYVDAERPEAERRVIRDQFWIIQRWLATAKGNMDWWTLALNEYVNPALTPLAAHPELIWKLMASCSLGRAEDFRNTWIGAPATSRFRDDKQRLLARYKPGAKHYELAGIMAEIGEPAVRHWLMRQGCPVKELDDAGFAKAESTESTESTES